MAEHEIRLDILSYNSFADTVDWRGFRALPDNLPQHLSGMYVAIHLDTGRPYVGIAEDVARRLRAHAMNNSPKRLKAAIRKYGKDRFIILPIYYSIDGTDGLEELETALIEAFDAIERGFNVCAAKGRVGPYGPAHGETVRAGQSPEGRERIRQAAIENYAKSADALRAAKDAYNNSPEGKLANAEKTRAMWRDPVYREKVIAGMNASTAYRSEERSAKVTASWENAEERRQKTAETFAKALAADPEAHKRGIQRSIETRKRQWADPVWAANRRAQMREVQAAIKARKAAEKEAARVQRAQGVVAPNEPPTHHDTERQYRLPL